MSTLDREVAREFGLEIVKMIDPDEGEAYRDAGEAMSAVLESIGIRAFRRALEIAEQTDFGERGES